MKMVVILEIDYNHPELSVEVELIREHNKYNFSGENPGEIPVS